MSTIARPLSEFRVAVLGSTSGIGRATAIELARSGADIIVHGRSPERASRVSQECFEAGSKRSIALTADLADRKAGDELVERAWSTWSRLDAWIHFAGADTLTGSQAKLTFDQKLDLLWSVDVVGTMRLCREVGRRMKEAGGGAIVTMGWDQAETGMEGSSGQLFAATKGAVMAFTRSLAVDLAPEVRVNCIAPGWIKTTWGDHASDAWQKRAVAEAPLARWGTPQDIANLSRFLVSRDAAFVTGQIIRVNGGAVR
jgi:3-oxoacyl-[acyl-carrier protein] reductase